MRITGGQWRGRRLGAVPKGATRPTTDRVREALFNLLQGEIAARHVVDCCCGTGALGLEALSRGARRVDFVDISAAALHVVRANLETCGAERERWGLHRGDATRWLTRALAADPGPDVILADPPYDGPVAAAILGAVNAGTSPDVVVLEHPAHQQLPAIDAERWRHETRTYGNSALTILRPRRSDHAEEHDG
jgi:16S rRNA (guanine966-N2)-methyltransferase